MTETRKMIEDCDRWHRDANMRAMKANGWQKRVLLNLAAWWSFLGDWGREIERDEQRGKDDRYHDEY